MTAQTLIPIEQSPPDAEMFIYVLRNRVNGKSYVGQDGGLVKHQARIKAHFADSRSVAAGKPHRCASKIIPAILKYGEGSFDALIHSWGHTSKAALDESERQAIQQLDAVKNGYNIRPGGQGFPSNRFLDSEELANVQDARRRGSAKANANRWGLIDPSHRAAHLQKLFEKRVDGQWISNLKSYWDNLSAEERAERGRQMREGRSKRYILTKSNGEIIIETNLRKLIDSITPPIPPKQIERIVRDHRLFTCDNFTIKQEG